MFTFEKAKSQIDLSDTSYCEVYQTETILPYLIKENDQIIGYLFAEKHDTHSLYIEFIEIVDDLKENGYGTKVVKSLFDEFNVNYLTGTVMVDDGHRAYYFWVSLGADLSVSPDEYEDFHFYDDIHFTLEKNAI